MGPGVKVVISTYGRYAVIVERIIFASPQVLCCIYNNLFLPGRTAKKGWRPMDTNLFGTPERIRTSANAAPETAALSPELREHITTV